MKKTFVLIVVLSVGFYYGCSTPEEQMEKAKVNKKPSESFSDVRTMSGVVIEKRANVKSYEAWNAPSDPYYVLDLGKTDQDYMKHMRKGFQRNKHHVTLRPSKAVTIGDISWFKDKHVTITAEYTDGEWYKPIQPTKENPKPIECYPIEPGIIIESDGTIKEGAMRPTRRGRGYIVYSINEYKQETPNKIDSLNSDSAGAPPE